MEGHRRKAVSFSEIRLAAARARGTGQTDFRAAAARIRTPGPDMASPVTPAAPDSRPAPDMAGPAPETNGCPPLVLLAALGGSAEEAQSLLKGGASPNESTSQGWSALMEACFRGNVPLTRMLIESGADVNARSADGWTPVLAASFYRRTYILMLLAEHGAHIGPAVFGSPAEIIS